MPLHVAKKAQFELFAAFAQVNRTVVKVNKLQLTRDEVLAAYSMNRRRHPAYALHRGGPLFTATFVGGKPVKAY